MPKHHDYDALPTDAHAPSFRQELRVVAAVILFICVLEMIARIIAPHLDYDRENIYRFPQDITHLEESAKKSKAPRVVFFGNSLMLHGLDETIFHEESQTIGAPKVESCKITPVGTAMLDWVYLYRRYFAKPSSAPDILVVGFVRHHIYDQEPIKLRRLSRHFVKTPDLPVLWHTDLENFHQKVQSTLCHFSALEGDQPEYPLGILYTIVPDYKAGLKKNNRLIAADNERKAKALAKKEGLPFGEPESTFNRMTRFIEFAQAQGVQLVFVPMPQPHVWDFNPKAAKIITDHGATILDARRIPGMTDSDFSDGYHLGETGKEKFSRWLAREMQAKHIGTSQ
jgi:hypothetical protein